MAGKRAAARRKKDIDKLALDGDVVFPAPGNSKYSNYRRTLFEVVEANFGTSAAESLNFDTANQEFYFEVTETWHLNYGMDEDNGDQFYTETKCTCIIKPPKLGGLATIADQVEYARDKVEEMRSLIKRYEKAAFRESITLAEKGGS